MRNIVPERRPQQDISYTLIGRTVVAEESPDFPFREDTITLRYPSLFEASVEERLDPVLSFISDLRKYSKGCSVA